MKYLPYDPGVLPTKHHPSQGEKIMIKLDGFPPYKDEHFSMRNPRHPNYNAFLRLRKEAIKVMGGKAWYFGPVGINFVLYAPEMEKNKSLHDYIAGIQDTLDGSSGGTFTYLPIVFEDDCQVVTGGNKFIKADDIRYQIEVEFL